MLQRIGSTGLALSPDAAHMVVSHDNHTLSVFSLPGGEFIRTFGSKGSGKAQFGSPRKICFTVAGAVLAAEYDNMRVQEVTLTGDHVRFIGAGVIDDRICGIASNAELIVVGKSDVTSGNRIMMFDVVTGVVVRAFGTFGNAPGKLMRYCNGIRFMPDSRHIIIAESKVGGAGGRLSVYTLAGEFVKCIGEGKLKGARDVEFAENGDIIVCDGRSGHSAYIFAADGSTLLHRWGGEGDADGKFKYPTALAMCGGQLYVLDLDSKRVQVFG